MSLRIPTSPSGKPIAACATGSYEGNAVSPTSLQSFVLGFQPVFVNIVVQASTGPDTAFQIAKTPEMNDAAGGDEFDAFFQTAGSAGLSLALVRLDEDGFTVKGAANAPIGPGGVVSPYFFTAF